MILISIANKMLAKILFWRSVSGQRKDLRRMSDDLLKDIGISRTDADREGKRIFWDHSPFEDVSLRRQTGSVSKMSERKTNFDSYRNAH